MPYNKKNNGNLVIGIDFGTDSCRALAVDTDTGEELTVTTSCYRRWGKRHYCDNSQNKYRQHPLDYIESLQEVIRGLLAKLPPNSINNIVAIGCDTTSSTVCMTDSEGAPLALLPQYADNPDAMFVLWKDHTAIKEADEINALSHRGEVDYTVFSGGNYSPEWFWAKTLHLLRNDQIREEAYAVIELCDWIPALLTGVLKPEEVKRSRCAAGHKCMWAEEWGGYPSRDFLSQFDPQLGSIRNHLMNETFTNDRVEGSLTPEWANKLGLSTNVIVSTGIIDAHAAAIGAGVKPGTMVKIVGTSTCDIMVVPRNMTGNKKIEGISGQVDGSVLPGMIGIEAGQSAFGDVYAWFRNLLGWTLEEFATDQQRRNQIMERMLSVLSEKAALIPTDEFSLVSLDFLNGRRTPNPDPAKKGIISGITLGTTAPEIFKSLVEATAFGSKAIYEHYKKEGLELVDNVSVGGISQKSPYVMQTLSNVMGLPIKVAQTEQAGALGAAMCTATAAGIFARVEDAQHKMESGISRIYRPDEKAHALYNRLYQQYLRLGTL
ncbi:ribulokinase [uncultured Proteiniphilum sp.]|uniref:ribulokinase n=1 Tax=uncultured Proteiniphilum sp. TaxID=497637 RepID=UPI00262F880B|nr:ribulokinase [uncultured Proteiniphilum sp.]